MALARVSPLCSIMPFRMLSFDFTAPFFSVSFPVPVLFSYFPFWSGSWLCPWTPSLLHPGPPPRWSHPAMTQPFDPFYFLSTPTPQVKSALISPKCPCMQLSIHISRWMKHLRYNRFSSKLLITLPHNCSSYRLPRLHKRQVDSVSCSDKKPWYISTVSISTPSKTKLCCLYVHRIWQFLIIFTTNTWL